MSQNNISDPPPMPMQQPAPTRWDFLKRFLFSIVYLIIFELVTAVVQLTVFFQFAFLIIAKQHSEPLRKFSQRVAGYGHEILRYLTLNQNSKPFPFGEFPPEEEQREPIDFA